MLSYILTCTTGPLSCAIEPDGSAMGTADRLGITLTLILTAVAYKFIVASSLPQVSYLTKLDIHVLLCFAFLIVNAIENVLYPIITFKDDIKPKYEIYFVIGYYITYVTINIIFFGYHFLGFNKRKQLFSNELTIHKITRMVYREMMAKHDCNVVLINHIISKICAQNGIELDKHEEISRDKYKSGEFALLTGKSTAKVHTENDNNLDGESNHELMNKYYNEYSSNKSL